MSSGLASSISQALSGRRGSNGNFLCRCPVPNHGNGHGDKTHSLSIKDGPKGLLVYCFAGCSGREIYKELRARGLLPKTCPSRTAKAVEDPWKDGRAKIQTREDVRSRCEWIWRLGPDGLIAFVLDLKRQKNLDELLQSYATLACDLERDYGEISHRARYANSIKT